MSVEPSPALTTSAPSVAGRAAGSSSGSNGTPSGRSRDTNNARAGRSVGTAPSVSVKYPRSNPRTGSGSILSGVVPAPSGPTQSAPRIIPYTRDRPGPSAGWKYGTG